MTKIQTIENIVQTLENKNCEVFPVVEGYTLRELVGQGAFAYVFRGTSDRFGRFSTAVKFPKHEDAFEDIRTRQVILSALGESQYSTTFVAEGEYEGIPFIVEEFCSESLADVFKQHKEPYAHLPSEDKVKELAKSLLKGISYFHSLEYTDPKAAELLGLDYLVHGDIKPSNILRGEKGWQFTDFGIRMEEQEDGSKLISSMASLKSIKNPDSEDSDKINLYAAPEVQRALLLNQEPPATIASDLWSIGAVLFHYATGKAPTWGDGYLQLTSHVSSDFAFWLAKLIDGNPSKRPESANSALEKLNTICDKFTVPRVTDDYIIGLGHRHSGKYFIFKQPMDRFEPFGKQLVYEFQSDATQPHMLYVEEFDLLILYSGGELEKEYKKNEKKEFFEKITLLDSFFEELDSVSFPKQYQPKYLQARKKQIFKIAQSKINGQLVLRQKSLSADCALPAWTTYDLTPKLRKREKDSSIDSTRTSNWNSIQNHTLNTQKKYRVIITEGRAKIQEKGFFRWKDKITLDEKYLIDAIWVPYSDKIKRK